MPKEKKSNNELKERRININDLPISLESLNLNTRIGVSSNLVNFTRLSDDEIVLDFLKVTASEKVTHKDLVSRVTLSLANVKALRDLLNRQLKE